MNKAHTEILKVKPIRFYPSASGSESGESMATVWNDCHGENGIRFHPPIHMVADANQNRQAIKDGENLLGPVEEGVEIKNADLVGHDPLHECDHVRLIAISYFFSKEIKEKMRFPDVMDGKYFNTSVKFIARTESQALSAAAEKELGYLPECIDQETSTSQGMSTRGERGGVAELTAEAHVNGQSGKECPQCVTKRISISNKIEQIYDQEKERIEKNPYYRNTSEKQVKDYAIMSKVLRALEAKCQTLAEDEHAKASMDNASGFLNRINGSKTVRPTLFQKTLDNFGIRHKLIKPYTPRQDLHCLRKYVRLVLTQSSYPP